LRGRERLFESLFLQFSGGRKVILRHFFLERNDSGGLSDTLEKDRDALTDKINNGIIIMDKKIEDAFAFRLKAFEKMRSVSA